MTHWTLQRRISFGVHTGIVLIPFSFSAVSAWLFWYGLFHDAAIASAMVVVVDVLALLGLILYITHISSPFQGLRHALPFVSIVPLGIELYSVLEPNGWGLAALIAALATGIMVTVAALCFRTIEQLFIPPLEAVREKAERDVQALLLTMEQLRVVSSAVDVFRGVAPAQAPVLALDDDSTALETTPPALSKTQRVKQMALAAGVSESTMWRNIQRGIIVMED